MFDRVRGLDNEFARLETSVVSLDWNMAQHLELIERRLNFPFSTKLKLGGETWDHFFEKIQGQPSWKYVLHYCQLRPRDIVIFCSYAIQNAQNNGHRSFSESRLKDLDDEYSENYPQLQVVLAHFYGLGQRYTVPGLSSFIKKLIEDSQVKTLCSQWIFRHAAPEKFIDLFHNIGFFGIEDGPVVHFRAPGSQAVTLPPLTNATTIHIHPCYVAALSLQDRLVAQLQDETPLRESGIVFDLPDSMGNLTNYTHRLNDLEENLRTLPRGKGAPATQFEDLVGDIIRLCFFRSLGNVQPKSRTINNTMVRDWIASNIAASGFWEMIRHRYQAMQVTWECKNYDDLHSDDFHQTLYYLTPAIGRFGVLAFRGEIKSHYYQHIKELVANTNGQAMILLLTESDLRVFLRQSRKGTVKESHIQEKYDHILRSI